MSRSERYPTFYRVEGVTFNGYDVYRHPQCGYAIERGETYLHLQALSATEMEDVAWAEQCEVERGAEVEEANPSLAGRE